MERNDYLATIRRLERDGLLLHGLLERMAPLVRRDCNYSNVDRLKKEAVWDEESGGWRLPDVTVQKTTLPSGSSRVTETAPSPSLLKAFVPLRLFGCCDPSFVLCVSQPWPRSLRPTEFTTVLLLMLGTLARCVPATRQAPDPLCAFVASSFQWARPVLQVEEDRYKEMLNRSDSENVISSYFKLKRTSQLLGREAHKGHGKTRTCTRLHWLSQGM